MSHPSTPLSSFPSIRREPSLLLIVIFVVVLHLFLIILGSFWEPAHPEPKKKPKLVVQTVRLKPFQSEIAQLSAPSPASLLNIQAELPVEKPNPPPPIPESIIQEIPPQQKEAIPKEDISSIQEIDTLKETPVVIHPPKPPAVLPATPAPAPLPSSKGETKPQTKPPAPKPPAKETPKKTPQPVAPVKKPAEPAKAPPKIDPKKQKQAEEAEKKRQQEQAEKKRQQEKLEAEKRRQKEIAEAEKKRQLEIAAVQEVARQKEQTALTKAKENLAKMNQTRDKLSASSTVNLDTATLPKELVSLHVDALSLGGQEGSNHWGIKEASYSDEVAYRLKMNLKLPDYGAVKIKLTLDRTGKVKKVEILKSESNKNKTYVESKIPAIVFSPFGQKFQGASENTFVITLQNNS